MIPKFPTPCLVPVLLDSTWNDILASPMYHGILDSFNDREPCRNHCPVIWHRLPGLPLEILTYYKTDALHQIVIPSCWRYRPPGIESMNKALRFAAVLWYVLPSWTLKCKYQKQHIKVNPPSPAKIWLHGWLIALLPCRILFVKEEHEEDRSSISNSLWCQLY